MPEDRAGQRLGREEQQQPEEPGADVAPRPGREVPLGDFRLGRHAGEVQHVLRLLLDQDVDDVVHRHDSERAVLVVHDRDRVNVVLGHETRDFLLRRVGVHAPDAPVHQLGDLLAGRRGEELAKGDGPDEVSVVVHGVEALDRLDLRVHLLQVLQGLGHGPLGTDRRELLRHQAPRRPRRVAEQALGLGGVAGRHLLEQRLALPLRQALEQKRDFVAGHAVELRPELLGRGAMQDEPERLAFELREHGRSLLGRQRFEQNQPLFLGQLVQELRDVGRMQVGHGRRYLGRVLADQLLDVGNDDLGKRHAAVILTAACGRW